MLQRKKIAIIGYGYVGKAMTKFFSHRYEVIAYDPIVQNVLDYSNSHIGTTIACKNAINDCDVAVVCVPTEPKEDGRCDTSIVEEVMDWIFESSSDKLIILKSTVEPGTTDRLRLYYDKQIIFSPEYAGESTYWSPYSFDRDVIETPFFTFGGQKEATQKAVDLYMPLGGPTKKYLQTDAKTVEMVKYITNCFYATKVAFCYEIANVCEKMGIDYSEARELWLQDPRVNPMHTAVFAENDLPFGGKCLPKDLSALTTFAQNAGYDASLLQAVIDTNERIGKYRKSQRK